MVAGARERQGLLIDIARIPIELREVLAAVQNASATGHALRRHVGINPEVVLERIVVIPDKVDHGVWSKEARHERTVVRVVGVRVRGPRRSNRYDFGRVVFGEQFALG
jgi:hypothetical protein